MQTHSKFEITSELQNSYHFNSFSIKVSSFMYLLNFVVRTNFISFLQFYFLELQLINSREATVLSFVFKDSQQQHCSLRNMIIECHDRSDLSQPGARANQIAISSFCPLFHFTARYFNENSKETNQSDFRNNA